jgi:hypothetical protein
VVHVHSINHSALPNQCGDWYLTNVQATSTECIPLVRWWPITQTARTKDLVMHESSDLLNLDNLCQFSHLLKAIELLVSHLS